MIGVHDIFTRGRGERFQYFAKKRELFFGILSPRGFQLIRVTPSLVLCVCFIDLCLSFCTFALVHCVVCFSSISDYPFDIFNLFTILTIFLVNWHYCHDKGHSTPGTLRKRYNKLLHIVYDLHTKNIYRQQFTCTLSIIHYYPYFMDMETQVYCIYVSVSVFMRRRRGRDRMVVGFKLPVQSVPVTTNVVRSNPTQASCTRYNM